ncbi:MAG: acyl-CoA dehydrogenase [Pseudomonadota bacterium]|nr:acyl-CoA dehydrogenase [Pseudomonadota bacterium]
MNFDLTEEQELFRSSIERFAGDLDSPARRALRSQPGGYDKRRWTALAEMGALALAASEEQGGLGGQTIDLAVIGEALGRAIAPDPWLENGVLPARLLALAGENDVLAGVLAGEIVVAAALAERQARYSVRPRQTKAKTSGSGYVLTGEKTFVLGGGLADKLIISADLDGATALFLVDTAAAGINRRDYRIVDGSVASELQLLDVQCTAESRLALDAAALDSAVAEVRLLAAAEMVGLAQRLFDDTLAYVKQREQFGVPIGTFQVIQHRMVDCYAKLEQARSTLLRAAMADPAGGQTWRRTALGAKAYIGEVADHIAREAVQLHGGMGITEELSIGHAMKRVLMLASLFGSSDATLAEYAEAA